jgi:hypothetical protein
MMSRNDIMRVRRASEPEGLDFPSWPKQPHLCVRSIMTGSAAKTRILPEAKKYFG